MDEWAVVTFSDLIDQGVLEIGDGYRAKNDELGGDGPIFLRAGLVQDDGIDLSKAERFLAGRIPAVAGKMSRPGDVLVTTKGNSTGRTAFVDGSLPPVVYSPHLSYWRSKRSDVLAPGYLRYWSQSEYFRRQLAGMAASTDMAPYLSLSDQRRLRIELPPIDVQRRAARILGSLDDKIELNRRMSETLQLTAQTLFKSWFMAEAGTEADGWRSCTIDDLAEVVGGSTPSTAEPRFWNGSHCWATPKDLAGLKTPVLLRTERMLTDAGIGQISSGLLPAGTMLMSSRAPIGYLAIAEVPVAINQGFIAIKPRAGISGLYLLQWAASAQDQILSRANGSTFLEISKANFRPIEVLAPPSQTMAAFDRVARPIHDRVVANERQIDVLARMRDALLPRLLSGEASLPAAAGI